METYDYFKDYIKLQEQYGGEFIALYRGSVVAHAKTVNVVFKSIEDKIGDEQLLIAFIEPYGAVCVY